MRRARRLVPLMLLLLPRLLQVAVAIGVGFGFGHHIGWDTLAHHQSALMQGVAAHSVLAPVLFLLVYVLTAALSLPNASVVTVAGGLLFGTALGSVLSVVGATVGAALLLLFVRSALGDVLRGRGGPMVEAMLRRLQRDGFSYLLALRLVPLAPFWAVNLAAGFCGMRLRAFVPATLLGIIPASVVLSSIGSGVGAILAAGRTPDLSVLFAPRIVLPLLGLAALAVIPALLRRRLACHA